MATNFYPEQYEQDSQLSINHNYLAEQFADYQDIFRKLEPIIRRGDFTLGEVVDKFEADFAALNGGEHGISVGSGTDALFLSLKALGIGPGDSVITSPFTFYATVGAIVTAGARPVFVDIGDDYNIDPRAIETAIEPTVKAIVPIHWSGNPCEMVSIEEIARKHQLNIVADACHAIKATYRNQGIAAYGTVSCFSMHPLKNLNVWGDGGIIVTNDDALAKRLSLLRNHGLQDRDTCVEFAYNSRLDTIQAVVAQHLLDTRIAQITERRVDNARYFDEHLTDIEQLQIPARASDKMAVYHLYMILCERRDDLREYLINNGVDAKVHYPTPMHLQPAAASFGYQAGDFPVAERVANNCLSLPVHEFITRDQQDRVIELIREFYR